MKIDQIDEESIQQNKKYIVYFNYIGEFYGVNSFTELVQDLRPDYPAEAKDRTQLAKRHTILAELASSFVQEYEFNAILAGTSALTLKPTPANPLITLVSSIGSTFDKDKDKDKAGATSERQLVVTSQTWSGFMTNLLGLAQGVQTGATSSPTEYIVVLPVDNEELFFQMLNLVGVVTIHDLAKIRPAAT